MMFSRSALKRSALLFTLFMGLLMVHQVALAQVGISPDFRPDYAPQGVNYDEGESAAENFNVDGANRIISDVIVRLLQVTGVIAMYFIVQNGFNYVKAFGQEEEIQKAKKGLLWAIVGLLVTIFSYAIVQNIIRIVLSVDG